MTEEFDRRSDSVGNLSEVIRKKLRIELAEEMLKDGEEFEKIKKYTHLPEEILKEIASGLGAAVVY